MPKFNVRKSFEAPRPRLTRTSRKNRDRQELYDAMVRGLGVGEVGDLELEGDETIRSVIFLLRRASARCEIPLDIWDADAHVYFRSGQGAKKRGAPVGRAADIFAAQSANGSSDEDDSDDSGDDSDESDSEAIVI